MKFFRFISFVFHPLLFSFIGTFLYLLLSPIHVAKKQEYIILTIIFISTYILPIFLLMILKKMKIIDSYYLKTIEERKFPTIFFIMLSMMIGKMLLNIRLVDLLAYSFFGIALALTISYFLFIKSIKTSLHTMGIGGIIGFILVMSYEYQLNFTIIVSLLFILAGLIGVSRLKLHAHNSSEVYLGFIIGMITQFISYQFY